MSLLRAAASFAANTAGQVVGALRDPALGAVLPVRRRGVTHAGDAWLRPEGELGTPGEARLLAMVHVHFPELVPGIGEALAAVPEPIDVVATSTVPLEPEAFGLAGTSVRVLRVANRGRDILPLLHVVGAGLADGYSGVVKVHTKRSSWRQDSERFSGSGSEWGAELLGGVLGGSRSIARTVERLRAPDGPALLTAPGQILGADYWGANLPATMMLARRLGLPLRPAALAFPAGSMYWVRPGVLAELRRLGLGPDNFEPETGQDDGTTAHAVERLIGVIAEAQGGLATTFGGAR